MKKVLIIGPIRDFGGRELEVGFIAYALRQKYEVTICSTGNLTKNSQVYHFNTKQKVVTLNQLLYKKHISLKVVAIFSFLKNFNKVLTVVNFTNNKLAKRYFNYNKKRLIVLTNLIKQYDLVVICAQLSSSLIPEISAISKQFKKPLLFRTTGAIVKKTIQNTEFLRNVNCFIHHSSVNAKNFEKYYFEHSFIKIDQCAFNEVDLIKLPLNNGNNKTFATISRIEKDKNIDVVIKAFLKTKNEGETLYVIGEGLEFNTLVNLANGDKSVIFTGFVSNTKIVNYLKHIDCVIVSYYKLETGPLTGIESMAAGKLIISSKTGAMEERLGNDCFWYDGTQEDLENRLNEVRELSNKEVFELSKKVRERYLESYRIATIEKKYLEVVDAYIK